MTTPTNNNIPSNSVQDRLYNAEKFDEFMNSDNPNYTDRKGITRWTLNGIRQIVQNWMGSLSTSSGASSIGTKSGTNLQDWVTGQTISLFDFLSQEKIDSVLNGDYTDITAELQSAMDANTTIRLPNGAYYVTESIVSSPNSSLLGDGPKVVKIDNRSSSHLFILGAGGYVRGCKLWSGFTIEASTENTKNAFAFFYSDRQTEAGAPDYTVGQKFSQIEINAWGRLGGGWYMQECFRVLIKDCGATGLSHCFKMVGSVVQTTIDNFIHNGDSSVVMDGADYTYGLTTEIKTYGNGTVFSPEGLTVTSTRFVSQGVGCKISGGLFLQFTNVEFDYSRYYGAWYNGGSQANFSGCYVGAAANRPGNFVGFFIPATSSNTPEAVNVKDCTVNMQANTNTDAANYTQYGVQIGNSTVPSRSTVVSGCVFRGAGYTSGIYVYRGTGVELEGNRFQFTGVNIKVDECSSLTMLNNTGNGSGSYSLTTSNSNARWFLVNNTETFSTLSHPNPKLLYALNSNYVSGNVRRLERASSAVNVSVPAGGSYKHTVAISTSLSSSIVVGGVIPDGLLFSASPATTNTVKIIFYNYSASPITLTTTLYIDSIFEPTSNS